MGKVKRIIKATKDIIADESRTFARTPREFRIKDWKNALLQTKNAFISKRIGILAAGVAYYATLAIFPAIAAGVALLSLVISKTQLTDAVHSIETFLPSDIASLVSSQLTSALENPSSSVAIAIIGLLVAFFSISGGATKLISACNAIYEQVEARSFIRLRFIGLIMIIIGGVLLLAILLLLLLNETWLNSIGVPSWLSWTIIIIRWPIIAAIVAAGLATFYRYAPNRKVPHLQWVTWGSGIATVLWLLGTTLFFVYARYFAHYTESYSVFAGIIVLMIWFNLSVFAVLIGAEINYRLENQTRAKTTH